MKARRTWSVFCRCGRKVSIPKRDTHVVNGVRKAMATWATGTLCSDKAREQWANEKAAQASEPEQPAEATR